MGYRPRIKPPEFDPFILPKIRLFCLAEEFIQIRSLDMNAYEQCQEARMASFAADIVAFAIYEHSALSMNDD